MLIDLFLNHIYGKTSLYYKRFGTIGKDSRVWYPNMAIAKESLYIGHDTQILKNSRIQVFKQEGLPTAKIFIGNHCYLGYHLSILAGADITIEDWVLMAADVLVSSENHGMDPESEIAYMDQPLTIAPVHIKKGCWIGEKVVIMPGVTIGEKCIIGANSVVTKDVPDYSVAVGAPAKVVKRYDFDMHKWIRV